jgi:hypothetical protein
MVSQLPDPQLLTKAEAMVTQFEQSKVPGIWLILQKQQVIQEMRSRLDEPWQVNQGRQPFCGPASILFELIRHNPSYYVEICQNLFLIGGFHTQFSRWVSVSDKLRSNTGDVQMPQGDWMVLSTWRDAENLIFPVDPTAPEVIRNISGMTKSWEMVGWAREILGYRKVEYNHAYFTGDLEALQKANDAIKSGGVAFALINADGMLSDKKPLVSFPSHWVTILGNIMIQPGQKEKQVSFDIYTWARQMHVSLGESDFKKHLWGIVTGV